EMQSGGALVCETRHHIEAASHGVVVIGQNGLRMADSTAEEQGSEPERAAQLSHVHVFWFLWERRHPGLRVRPDLIMARKVGRSPAAAERLNQHHAGSKPALEYRKCGLPVPERHRLSRDHVRVRDGARLVLIENERFRLLGSPDRAILDFGLLLENAQG